MKSRLFRLISFLVYPFQHSKWIEFFMDYNPFGDDAQAFYFSLYGERSGVYFMDEKFLNKPLLQDLQYRYPGFVYLNHFLNSAYQSDITISNCQQMHFFVMLKSKLFIEFDSIQSYRIYYDSKKGELELQKLLLIFRKHQKTDWPRSLRYIYYN